MGDSAAASLAKQLVACQLASLRVYSDSEWTFGRESALGQTLTGQQQVDDKLKQTAYQSTLAFPALKSLVCCQANVF